MLRFGSVAERVTFRSRQVIPPQAADCALQCVKQVEGHAYTPPLHCNTMKCGNCAKAVEVRGRPDTSRHQPTGRDSAKVDDPAERCGRDAIAFGVWFHWTVVGGASSRYPPAARIAASSSLVIAARWSLADIRGNLSPG